MGNFKILAKALVVAHNHTLFSGEYLPPPRPRIND